MASQRGSALVLVLMTVAALLIVGVSLVSASTVEFRSAINQSHSTQAFYVAEAGLRWARRTIVPGSLPTSGTIPQILYRSSAFGGTSTDLAGIGELDVTVTRIADGRWELRSTGLQHQARRTVSWQITQAAGVGIGVVLDRHAVLGNLSLDNNAHVYGNIFVNQSLISRGNNSVITGTVTPPPAAGTFVAPTTYPFPSQTLLWRGDLQINNNQTAVVSANGQYGTINIENNGNLQIRVDSAETLIVRLGSLTMSNNASLTITGSGTGRVVLHVNGSLRIANKNVDINQSGNAHGDPTRLEIYVHGNDGGTAVHLNNNLDFSGSLLVSNGSVLLDNNVRFNGNIVLGGGNVRLDNNAHLQGVVFAPATHVTLANNASVTGAVVAGSYLGNNNSVTTFEANRVVGFNAWASHQSRYIFSTWNVHP